jgi:HSF-type DNA-binding
MSGAEYVHKKQEFPLKLRAMISAPTAKDTIVWVQDTAFTIQDKPAFVKLLRECEFKTGWAGFIKQLNNYGFKSVSFLERCN